MMRSLNFSHFSFACSKARTVITLHRTSASNSLAHFLACFRSSNSLALLEGGPSKHLIRCSRNYLRLPRHRGARRKAVATAVPCWSEVLFSQRRYNQQRQQNPCLYSRCQHHFYSGVVTQIGA